MHCFYEIECGGEGKEDQGIEGDGGRGRGIKKERKAEEREGKTGGQRFVGS